MYETNRDHVCRNPWGGQGKKVCRVGSCQGQSAHTLAFLLENKAIVGLLRAEPRYSLTPAFLLPCLDR